MAKKKLSKYDLCPHLSRMVCPLDDRYDMCANAFCTDRDRDKRKRQGYWAPPPAPVRNHPKYDQPQLF